MGGNNVRRNFDGDRRKCARCPTEIVVTKKMVKYGRYICSSCQVASVADWNQRHREQKRNNNAAYQARHAKDRAERTRRYRAANPEKRAAHQAVQTALRNGSMVRRGCEVCGAKASAHHDDYTKPLDVRWLCHAHHMEHHGRLSTDEDIAEAAAIHARTKLFMEGWRHAANGTSRRNIQDEEYVGGYEAGVQARLKAVDAAREGFTSAERERRKGGGA